MGVLFGIWGGMWLVFGLINVGIMTSKLRSGWGGFFLGLLGIIGLIIALVLKDYRPYLKAVGINHQMGEEGYGNYMKNGKALTKGQVRIEISEYIQTGGGVPFQSVAQQPVATDNSERTTAQKLQNLDNLLADNLITKTEYNKMTKEVMNEHKTK